MVIISTVAVTVPGDYCLERSLVLSLYLSGYRIFIQKMVCHKVVISMQLSAVGILLVVVGLVWFDGF